MRRRGTFTAALAVGAALLISSGSASARTAMPDLSSTSKVDSYLRSLGVDPATVVVQRGARNYAGSQCPGKAWNCTRATRVLQISSGGPNSFECTGGGGEGQTCFVSQSSPGGNTARCTEKSDAGGQSCQIHQTSTTGDNHAIVDQLVKQQDGSSQTASQDSIVTQTSGTGDNDLHASQKIEQSSKDDSATVAQSQDGHQSSSAAQTSVSGKQESQVNQSLSQEAKASDATGGSQMQTSDIVGHLDQASAGVSKNHNRQDEDQKEFAPKDSAVAQTQYGPLDCCSDQGTNPKDHFDIDQSATQLTSSDTPLQSESVTGHCTTTGTCSVRQSVNENGQHTTNTCTGSTCSIAVVCSETVCTPIIAPPPCGVDCSIGFLSVTRAVQAPRVSAPRRRMLR